MNSFIVNAARYYSTPLHHYSYPRIPQRFISSCKNIGCLLAKWSQNRKYPRPRSIVSPPNKSCHAGTSNRMQGSFQPSFSDSDILVDSVMIEDDHVLFPANMSVIKCDLHLINTESTSIPSHRKDAFHVEYVKPFPYP